MRLLISLFGILVALLDFLIILGGFKVSGAAMLLMNVNVLILITIALVTQDNDYD